MDKEFLPLGTVCLLKGAKKKIMVTGFCVKGNETGDKVFDYLGCLYPEGIISSDQNLLFDNEQIAEIYFKGYESEEDKEFKRKINEVLKEQALSEIETLDDEISEPVNAEIFNDMSVPVATIVSEDEVLN